ncbi:MAG TPA: DMT family transporter, partial [Chloroflexia bacterium]|nr:DMT family transporter [Chloroflexia bacterium]
MQNPLLKAYGALALGVLCIGFSAIFTRWAEVPGSVSAFYRVLIATVVLAIPFALQSARRPAPQDGEAGRPGRVPTAALWLTALAGMFFALDLGFWNTSLFYTSAANSTLLGNTSTLWVSLAALLIFHESLKRRFWLGMAIALVGAAIVVGRDVFEHPNLGFGDLLSVFSSFFYAGYLLLTGRARQHMGTL